LIQYIISTNNPVTTLALPLRLHGVVIFHRAPSDRSEVWYCSRRWRCHGVLHSFCATSAVFAIQCVTVTAIYVRVSIKLFFMIPYSCVQLFKYFQLKWLPFLFIFCILCWLV